MLRQSKHGYQRMTFRCEGEFFEIQRRGLAQIRDRFLD